MPSPEQESDHPRVFLSYAWEDGEYGEYRKWIERLARALCRDGIHVRLDKWHHDPTIEFPSFMYSEVDDADLVLVVGSPGYSQRLEAKLKERKESGAAWEAMLTLAQRLSGEPSKMLVAIGLGNRKDALPRYLKAYKTFDLVGPNASKEYRALRDAILRDAPEDLPPIPVPRSATRGLEPLFDGDSTDGPAALEVSPTPAVPEKEKADPAPRTSLPPTPRSDPASTDAEPTIDDPPAPEPARSASPRTAVDPASRYRRRRGACIGFSALLVLWHFLERWGVIPPLFIPITTDSGPFRLVPITGILLALVTYFTLALLLAIRRVRATSRDPNADWLTLTLAALAIVLRVIPEGGPNPSVGPVTHAIIMAIAGVACATVAVLFVFLWRAVRVDWLIAVAIVILTGAIVYGQTMVYGGPSGGLPGWGSVPFVAGLVGGTLLCRRLGRLAR